MYILTIQLSADFGTDSSCVGLSAMEVRHLMYEYMLANARRLDETDEVWVVYVIESRDDH